MADIYDILMGYPEFQVEAQTDTVNKAPYVPGQISATGEFNERGIPTTYYAVEENAGTVELIPVSDREAPVQQGRPGKRKRHIIEVPALVRQRPITATAIQNALAFGSRAPAAVQSLIDEQTAAELRNFDATIEYHRIGALKGKIIDADGLTVLLDLFQVFGLTQKTLDMKLNVGGTKVRSMCLDIHDSIGEEMGGSPYKGVAAWCGKNFFRAFVDHPVVAKAYETWNGGEQLRNDPRAGFPFGDIVWRQYRGKVGNIPFVGDDEAYAQPTGSGAGLTRFAPGNFLDAVQEPGLPRYVRLGRDPSGLNQFVTVHVESNPLSVWTRPSAVIKLTMGGA